MIERDGFFERVYEITKKIPYGRVSTYGAIAKYLGTGGSARVVGWALTAPVDLASLFLHTGL